MKNKTTLVTMMIAMLTMGICQYVQAAEPTANPTPATTETVYMCPHCSTMAMQAGKCPTCQKDMVASHVLGVKDGKVMCCSCGGDCKCDPKGMKDGKCSCGKDVTTISAKGMYVCPAGCAMVSDKAAKCAGCGKDMTKVE